MRIAVVLAALLIADSGAALAMSTFPYPDRELRQIVVRGSYAPEDPTRLDEFRQEVVRQGRLKPGETFEEKYKHLLRGTKEGSSM